MTFPETSSDLRNDSNFSNRRYEDHHTGVSPLEELGVGMVSQFPVDSMHNLYIGVTKKLLKTLLKGSLKVRLSGMQVQSLSSRLVEVSLTVPDDFSRKPRCIKEIDRWKATEFRLFLLYLAPVVLKDVVSKEIYDHFMLLHCSARILSSPTLVREEDKIDYAEQLLKLFVQHCIPLYGPEFITYNVHCLVHLPNEARRFGPLEMFSAFPYENYLNSVKRLLRSNAKPLEQLCKRLSESDSFYVGTTHKSEESFLCTASKEHSTGPFLPGLTGTQYKIFNFFKFKLKCDIRNCCAQLISGKIIKTENIFKTDKQTFVLGREFLCVENYFVYPLESSSITVFKVSTLSELRKWSVEEIIGKCVLIQFNQEYICLPFLHLY